MSGPESLCPLCGSKGGGGCDLCTTDALINEGEIAYDLSPEERAEFEAGLDDGIEEIPF